MASKTPDEPFNITDTDEETIALRKKRSQRRVSFADREITSVHIFNRDEDCETPPKPPESPLVDEGRAPMVLGFFKDLVADSEEDSKDFSTNEEDVGDDEDEVDGTTPSFLRPLESPGSSIIGSATFNDDNFFGPVSSSFIRPGRLSDSAASNDNHDITMDSTAFSMHFRSLAGSEAGDQVTATGVRLAFEEKTPSQIRTPTDTGSFMALTKPKQLIPKSSSIVDEVSHGRDSNDMSLVGQNPPKYDYAKLSPGLEALLAEGSKDLPAASVSNPTNLIPTKRSEASTFCENESEHKDQIAARDPETNNFSLHEISAEEVSVSDRRFGETNAGNLTTDFGLISHDSLGNRKVSPAAGGIQSPNQSNKVGLLVLHDCEKQSSTEDCPKENFPIKKKLTLDGNQISAQQNGSPLAGSISSLSAKRRQIFYTANSPNQLLYMTPTIQPGSLNKQTPKQSDSMLSTQKSSSKLNIIKPSPYASTLQEKIETSRLRVAGYLSSNSSSFNTIKHLDLPIINLEDRLHGADPKSGETKVTVNMTNDAIGAEKDTDDHNEECADLVKGEPLGHVSKDILRMEEPQIIASATSPAHLALSGNILMQNSLMFENPKEVTIGVSESSSLPMEIGSDQSKAMQAVHASFMSVFPLVNLDEKLSKECESRISGHSKQLAQNNKFPGIISEEENLIEAATGGWPSSAVAGKLNSPGSSAKYSPPIVKVNSSKDLNQVKTVNDRDILSPKLRNGFETFRSFWTPSKDEANIEYKPGSAVKNLEIAADPFQSMERLPRDDIKAASRIYTSPYADRSSLQKILSKSELSRSPSRIQLHRKSHDDSGHSFDGGGMPSSQPKADEHCNIASYEGLDFAKSPGLKRKNREVGHGDTDHEDEISRAETAGKVQKSDVHDIDFMFEHSNGRKSREENTSCDTGSKHWTDISLKFSSDTNQLHSSSIAKINIREVGMLEDILVHLQKANEYAVLCSNIISQETNGLSCNKRVSEIRPLLNKIVYEKAKLQLLCTKREKLLSKGKPLSSGIEQMQTLKNNIPHFCLHGERNTEVYVNRHDSGFVSTDGKHEVASSKVTTKKHELEAVERKVKNLTESLSSICKIKGEPNCSDNIALIKDHLKQRTFCRLIRQDLQLWEVDDLESRNNRHSVVLNYLCLISQRFTRNVGPVSSISISNKLNDINIMKNFPNMDACTAFAFVLHAERTKTYSDSKSLTQETRSTSSLLRNLLDVADEVRVAQTQIRNLTHASFKSPSVEQLDLQLVFLDFSSGRKVTITLDLTCLKCGIYPSEILPSKIQTSMTMTESLKAESLSVDTKVATDSLRVGYSRILRLCECVSQVMQSKSK